LCKHNVGKQSCYCQALVFVYFCIFFFFPLVNIVPAGAPQNFTATGLTETKVRLEWDLPAKKLQNGEITMYQLVYHKSADPTDVEDLNITTLQIDIPNLEMNTDYVFQLKAYTVQGAGPWTTQLPFHTFGPSMFGTGRNQANFCYAIISCSICLAQTLLPFFI